MSIDLQEPMEGIESARNALDEFHSTHDEFTDFFGDVFDQLQTLSLELFARHKCLEVSTEQKAESAESLAGVRNELHGAIEQLRQLHGQLQADQQETEQSWAEIRAGYQRFTEDHSELREIREGFQQIANEFSGIKADAAIERHNLQEIFASVENQLALLSTVTTALAETQAQQTNDGQIAEVLEHTRQQQADWIEQRTRLEAELETMRRRAAEQAEALNEQKRHASQQQAEFTGELKRMRSLLETLASQVRGEPAPASQGAKPAVDSNALGSVLAQFEMLQRNITVRRSKRNNDPDPGPALPGSAIV